MDDGAKSTDGRRPPSCDCPMQRHLSSCGAVVKASHVYPRTELANTAWVGTGQVLSNLSNVQMWIVSRTAAEKKQDAEITQLWNSQFNDTLCCMRGVL